MKPLGTTNVAKNELTIPKSPFGKPISQCGLSTKSLKPRKTYHTRESILSASKSAFKTTNSKSKVSARKYDSVAPKVPAPKNKSTSAMRFLLS
ncbi:hypothetical protein BBM61_16635 [Vibrio parahaemolyticus]|uniref:Uncharacterized protein n=1 Tax=Vibrio parahaemolyticus TaxID=670 RepID=A0AAX0MK93_VIBPH|nr:hypothetical protein VP10329_14430 [Vibrio parahaemolyticus 10329]KIS73372.1 hypothetical protein H321_23410 [Vibrio parahaemolyticus 97-10290]KIS84418.1 hypothetical protein H338_23390 [Vibrio parahaemolyticus EN9701173]KIS85702.1 hypothetical protein H333_23425 [Vibrio parahaemolyticus 12315]KIS91353.1 hypothetical protein H324_23390 [Vibrio parahaemolyticus 846]KIS97016.1 hypothetical protein H327_23445 [Vibrio parahaemolyticus 3324]KIT01568.1 hypothetical protein H339_23445 [Vibrio par